VDCCIQICDAMVFLARHKVKVHGDLTPANCLLNHVGRIQLTDLGSAAAAREAEIVRGDLHLLRPETICVMSPNPKPATIYRPSGASQEGVADAVTCTRSEFCYSPCLVENQKTPQEPCGQDPNCRR
jgi:serine/threonine protein kinase